MGGRVDAPTGSLKPPIELGRSRHLAVGDVQADPPARRLTGPAGTFLIEPRVMQLLVALADGGGEVVPREELTGRCWPGLLVGEDSLNRAIAGLRRALKEAASQTVRVETVPKVGYRLATADAAPTPAGDTRPTGQQGPSRRRLIGWSAALAALGGTGWLAAGWRHSMRADMLVFEARQRLLIRDHGAENAARGILERALALDPESADAWGLLALCWQAIARTSPAGTLGDAETGARGAARHALALERVQGDALAALALLPPLFGDWHAAEARLTQTLDVAPENVAARAGMGELTASVGRMADSLEISGALLRAYPAHRGAAARRIQALWATNGVTDALAAAEAWQAGQSGRDASDLLHPWLLGFAGRMGEAVNRVDRLQAQQRAPSRILNAMRLSFQAMESRRADRIEVAETALSDLAPFGGGTNAIAILGLCGLGRIERAMTMAEAWYRDAGKPGLSAVERRARLHRLGTSVLFLPPARALRSHPRFLPLCEETGLAGYWRSSARRPDFMAGKYLPV